jgi:endonuclease/exonuclease/phosphatase family metal-dependent hydrolase
MRLIKAASLPALPGRRFLEPRGALWAAIDIGGVELHVVNTHLSLLSRERVVQAEALLAGGWLSHPACRGVPLVLLGDLNAVPRSRAYARLVRRLRDVQRGRVGARPRPTFPGRWPLLRIDHILVSPGVEVRQVEVRQGPTERVASDHLPLLAELRISGIAAR